MSSTPVSDKVAMSSASKEEAYAWIKRQYFELSKLGDDQVRSAEVTDAVEQLLHILLTVDSIGDPVENQLLSDLASQLSWLYWNMDDLVAWRHFMLTFGEIVRS